MDAETLNSNEHSVRFENVSERTYARLVQAAEDQSCAHMIADRGLALRLGMYVSGSYKGPTKHKTFQHNGRIITEDDMTAAMSVKDLMKAAYGVYPGKNEAEIKAGADFNHKAFEHVAVSYWGRMHRFSDTFFDHDHGSAFLHELDMLGADYRQRPFVLTLRPLREKEMPKNAYRNIKKDEKAFEVPCQVIDAEYEGAAFKLKVLLQVWHQQGVMQQLAEGEPIAYLGSPLTSPRKIRQDIQEGLATGRGKTIPLRFCVQKPEQIMPVRAETWSPKGRPIIHSKPAAKAGSEQYLLDL